MTPKAQANNNKNNKWDVIKIKTFYASQVVLVVINYMPMQETQETQVQSLGQEDPLEEGMQPTPVFLPRESSWTEEPGELQSISSQSQTW